MTARTLLGYRRNGAPIYLAQGGAPTPHEIISGKRDALLAQRAALLNKAVSEQRGLLASEKREHSKLTSEIAPLTERLDEIADLERRTKLDNAAHAHSGVVPTGLQNGYHTGGGTTYHRGDNSPGYFQDLLHARRGDYNAAQRLQQNNSEVGFQSRALGNTGATGGSGGEFAPPGWIESEYVKLARPGRVVADRFKHLDLPSGVSSVNIPKVATGTSVAPQTTQNTALAQTDMTTVALSSGIQTTGGKQVVSRQLLDQSPVAFDKVILEDLAADHARQLGTEAITGTGVGGQLRGYLTPASTSVITWTSTSPTAGAFFSRLAQLQGQIAGSRFKAPDAVALHPRRWSWLASAQDASGRPLVVPTSGGFNSMATRDDNQSVGHVGQVLGMDVWCDPNIPTTLGAGANQDVVLMMVSDDIFLWESPLQCEAFESPFADSMGVLYRCYNYSALIPDRYLASLGQISGTGLTTPVFA